MPVIPFVEVVGNIGGAPPEHSGWIGANDGVALLVSKTKLRVLQFPSASQDFNAALAIPV